MYPGGGENRSAHVPQADDHVLSGRQMTSRQDMFMKAITFAHSSPEQVSGGSIAEGLPGNRKEYLHRRDIRFRMDHPGNLKGIFNPGFSLPEELSDEV